MPRSYAPHAKLFGVLLAGLLLCCLSAVLWRHSSPAPPASRPAAAGTLSGMNGEREVESSAADMPAAAPAQAKPRWASEAYGKLPLSFVENRGQFAAPVKFAARGSGYTLFLIPNGAAVLTLQKPAAPAEAEQPVPAITLAGAKEAVTERSVLHMKLVGANEQPRVSALEELPGRTNYLIGDDPGCWHTGVPAFARVRYQDVYPGVDLFYYGNQRQLEYDFVVAPDTRPDQIRLAFDGAREIEVDAGGELVLRTDGGEIRQHKPLIYQHINGARQEVAGRYVMAGGSQVGFEIEEYDRSQPLVIDPVLSYASYLGGGGAEQGLGIALDAQGSAYVVGTTDSADFPGSSPVQSSLGGATDAFVLKLNPGGSSLAYATYLGGLGSEFGNAIAVDAGGNAYVTGLTGSGNFPITFDVVQPSKSGSLDAFVTKLNPSGSALVYSTFLGGNNFDQGFGIAVDSDGRAHVTGTTESTTFVGGMPISRRGSAAFKSVDQGGNWSASNNGLTDARATSLAAAPQTPATLYAGGPSGIFKSVDGGSSWSLTGQARTGTAPSSVNAVAVSPASSSIVFAGTSNGVFKSADAGNLWDRANTGLTSTTVFALVIDPSAPDTLYAGTFNGVFKSVDGAATWSPINVGLPDQGITLRVNKLALDPTNPNTLYAATTRGVFKSVNGGTSWAARSAGLGFSPGAPFPVSTLAVDPLTPATLYAGGFFGVYKSVDGGDSWSPSNAGLSFTSGSLTLSPTVTALAITPNAPATLYAGTNFGVYKSGDGGANWSASSTGLSNLFVTDLLIDRVAPATLYAATNSGADAFVARLAPTGSLLEYLTLLGGDEAETGKSIAVDAQGNAYVAGSTSSTNLPTVNPLQAARNGLSDAFAAKLRPTGAPVYVTYLGGSSGEQGVGVAADADGNAYITGNTSSPDFPVAGTRQNAKGNGLDAFITKLNPDGSALVYSVFHGGGGSDQGTGVAVDATGKAYVTGSTSSFDFPVIGGTQANYGGGSDAFVLKLNPDSSVIYSTYLGGGGSDQGFGIAADAGGNAYVTGTTNSLNFPTINPLQPARGQITDAFVAKLSPAVDLNLTMTDTPDPVTFGSNLTYTLTVRNDGDLRATGVTLSDTLPIGATFVSATATQGTCGGTDAVTCQLGSLDSGASATVTIVIAPPGVRTIINTATVTSNEPDAVAANNTASQSTQVDYADLSVSNVPVSDKVAPGGKLTYLVTASNTGGTTTGPITVTYNLPAGTTLVSCSSAAGAACTGTGNPRTVTFPSLAVGASVTVIFVVSVDPGVASGTTLSSTAMVSAALVDPNPGNNSATAAATVTTTPISLSGNGKIAFSSGDAPTLRIKTVNPNGSGLTNLTNGQTYERSPAWSPDGTKLAFRSEDVSSSFVFYDINVINADGSGLVRVTDHAQTNATAAIDAKPAWSPSGTNLAFVGRDRSIYVVGADGAGLSKLIDNSAIIDGLDWSPAGARFVFARAGDLYLMDVDGSNQVQLTSGPANDYAPNWSPDGTKILFTRSPTSDTSYGDAYVVNADGTGESRLLNINGARSAAWSPDGSKLAFHLGNDLHSIGVDGTGQLRLAERSVSSSAPDWQPLAGVSPSPTPTPGPVYTISGRVTGDDSLGFGTIVLSGTRTGMISLDAEGNYLFVNLPGGGNYTVTPTSIAYTFTPASRTFNNLSANQTAADFSRVRVHPTVSGRIVDPQGNGIGDIEVSLLRFGARERVTRTAANGNYSFIDVVPSRDYSVFPYHDRYTFEPSRIDLPVVSGDQTANFVGTQRQTIEFFATGYAVAEGAERASIDIVRYGDLSGPASVDVSTFDDQSPVRCDTVNGAAYARCDYATTIETARFAAGERLKTVTIPIIDDAHVEGTERVFINLSNPVGGILLGASVRLDIIDNDTAPSATNPVDQSPFFVRMQYLDFLSREPEPDGFQAWLNVLNNCSDVNNNPACDRITVSSSFFRSEEFQLKGYFVYLFYKSLNRRPAYGEITFDMRAVTGQTAEELFQKRTAFAERWVQRPEFQSLYGALSDAAFVDALLARYGGVASITTPDPANPDGTQMVTLTRNELVERLGTPPPQQLTRAQVLRAIIQSREVDAAEFNGAFVAMQYYGYLRRAPEEDGYQAWLRYLNTNPTDFRTMVNGFMNSVEYRLRFGAP